LWIRLSVPASTDSETSPRERQAVCCQTPRVRVVAAAGAGFLLAVLWFDLMFDVQVRRHHGAELPPDVRQSIATYYRRVTTTARPMNRLVAAVMAVTVGAVIVEPFGDDVGFWTAAGSLVLISTAITLAAMRTVRAAARLGAQTDSPQAQSALARAIYRDHVLCGVLIAAALALQITGR
jgi:hypothetical protein